jgi:hypothetical protein
MISYLAQLTNVGVGLLMLPLLLAFLSADEFLLWSLFTTIAGIFLQLEMAVQSLVVRHIAAHNHGSITNFERSIAAARRIYFLFALTAALLMTLIGGLYLSSLHLGAKMPDWQWQGGLFVASYFFNYLCGSNNCILIASERTNQFNFNNIASRLLNLATMAALLAMNYGITAMVVSFAMSVAVGCSLNFASARRSLRTALGQRWFNTEQSKFQELRIAEIGLFAIFIVMSYWFYLIILLIGVAIFPEDPEMPSLALALQLFAIFVAFALTPIQMRVAPLITSLKSGKPDEAAKEFVRIQLLVNSVVLIGGILLIGLSFMVADMLTIQVSWPSPLLVGSLLFAFAVECNLQVMANIFIAKKEFSFVLPYLFSSIIAGSVSLFMLIWLEAEIPVTIMSATAIQLLIAGSVFSSMLKLSIKISFDTYAQVICQDAVQLKSFFR